MTFTVTTLFLTAAGGFRSTVTLDDGTYWHVDYPVKGDVFKVNNAENARLAYEDAVSAATKAGILPADAVNVCGRCKGPFAPPPKPGEFGASGYGFGQDDRGVWTRTCYACCAKEDQQYMVDHGKHSGLYLTRDEQGYKVTNWPGSLVFRPVTVYKSKGRGFGGRTYPIVHGYFVGPDGKPWMIKVQGDMEVGRARRLKRPSRWAPTGE